MSLRFFGQYLIDKEVITAGILAKAVGIQESVNRSFGQTAQSMGLLTPKDVSRISQAQRTVDMLYGDVAVKMGLLTDKEVAQILGEQRRNHLYLGEALVRLGTIDKKHLNYLLNEFTKEQAPYSATGLELPDNVPFPHFCLTVWEASQKMLSRIVNLTIKPGTCELVKRLEGNNITAIVDFVGDISTRYVISFPAFVRNKIALTMLQNDHSQLDEIFCGKGNIDETIINFVASISNAIISKAVGMGIKLAPVKCNILNNDDNISVPDNNIALLFPFYLTTGEWIDVAIVLPT